VDRRIVTTVRPGRRHERLIVWLWRWLPLGGAVRSVIAWSVNLRYAVGVAAVITNERDEVLLLRHNYLRGAYEWGLPGGWAKGREHLEHALIRELREETGFEVVVTRLVAVHSGYTLPRLVIIYQARIAGGTFRASAEVMDYGFFPPDRLDNILPGERRAVCEALVLNSNLTLRAPRGYPGRDDAG
jgi:8-oxo-dGTP diphosphatase